MLLSRAILPNEIAQPQVGTCTFVQAAFLGSTVHVLTCSENVGVVGTQTGKFPYSVEGAPSLRGGAMGDQYVSSHVVTPTGLNDKQKEAPSSLYEA